MLRQGMLVCLSILLFASLPVKAACNTIFFLYPVWTCIDEPINLGGWIIYSVVCFIMWLGGYADPCPPTSLRPEPIAP